VIDQSSNPFTETDQDETLYTDFTQQQVLHAEEFGKLSLSGRVSKAFFFHSSAGHSFYIIEETKNQLLSFVIKSCFAVVSEG